MRPLVDARRRPAALAEHWCLECWLFCWQIASTGQALPAAATVAAAATTIASSQIRSVSKFTCKTRRDSKRESERASKRASKQAAHLLLLPSSCRRGGEQRGERKENKLLLAAALAVRSPLPPTTPQKTPGKEHASAPATLPHRFMETRMVCGCRASAHPPSLSHTLTLPPRAHQPASQPANLETPSPSPPLSLIPFLSLPAPRFGTVSPAALLTRQDPGVSVDPARSAASCTDSGRRSPPLLVLPLGWRGRVRYGT